MHARMFDGYLCDPLLALSVEAVALRLREDVLPALILHRPSFNACHRLVVGALGKETASELIAEIEGVGATFALTLRTRSLCVEVVVPGGTSNNLALLGNPKAFGERFVSFHS